MDICEERVRQEEEEVEEHRVRGDPCTGKRKKVQFLFPMASRGDGSSNATGSARALLSCTLAYTLKRGVESRAS